MVAALWAEEEKRAALGVCVSWRIGDNEVYGLARARANIVLLVAITLAVVWWGE